MYIEKRIKLRNNIYYVRVDVEYKKGKSGMVTLHTKNYKDDYYDGGDFSILIETIEKSYSAEKAKQYDEQIGFMADVMYIYDRVPFLSGIRDVYISRDDNLPYSIGYISKMEIEKYIEENHVITHENKDFKLWDARTWNV